MKNVINFAHKYTKLDYPIFPTIRGESWYQKKSRFWCVTVNHNYFTFAYLLHQFPMRISDIPLDLLVWDVAPTKIHSRYHFMEKLNTFRRFHKLETTDDFVCVLFFEKVWQ